MRVQFSPLELLVERYLYIVHIINLKNRQKQAMDYFLKLYFKDEDKSCSYILWKFKSVSYKTIGDARILKRKFLFLYKKWVVFKNLLKMQFFKYELQSDGN
jgi:hypothetical protein